VQIDVVLKECLHFLSMLEQELVIVVEMEVQGMEPGPQVESKVLGRSALVEELEDVLERMT